MKYIRETALFQCRRHNLRISMISISLQEIARVAEIYDMSADEVQEPSILGAALLLDGAEDKFELEAACLPLFSLLHWPLEEQSAYSASRTDTERNQVVLRRMDDWAAEIEVRRSSES